MNKTLIAVSTLSVTLAGLAIKRSIDLGRQVKLHKEALEWERVKSETRDTTMDLVPAIFRRRERI